MINWNDDARPRRGDGDGNAKPLDAEERRKRFARAIARAEFGRFYWREDPVGRVRDPAIKAKLATRPKSAVKVRKG